MDYQECLLYLNKVYSQGIDLNLNNTKVIIRNFPSFLKKIKFIQIGGTNGKGSTAFFFTSILKQSGFRVGLFTSPHLFDIRERISLNGELISRESFAASLCYVKKLSEKLLTEKNINRLPTYFEYTFLMAVYYFSQQKAEYAILEVGLGGRYDATTTITPILAVITNISYDHQQTLGTKIKSIAREKAGIIKYKIPVLTGCNVFSVSNRVIKEEASKKKAPFYNVFNVKNYLKEVEIKPQYSEYKYVTQDHSYKFRLQMKGVHQAENASTAIKGIEILNEKRFIPPLTKNDISSGIYSNKVPGRIEIIGRKPQIILDTSHNIHSIKALTEYLKQKDKYNLTIIFGILEDKNYRKILKLLKPFAKYFIITEPRSPRALAGEKLVKLLKGGENVRYKKNPSEAFKDAMVKKNDILITGSFYLTGIIRNLIYGEYYGKNSI